MIRMASYSNYRRHEAKYTTKINLFQITRNRRKSGAYADTLEEKIKLWTSFYRENPHRFVKDYLGIELHLFQVILLWAMMHNNIFMFIGSRGISKSFLSALFLVVRSILYPGTKIVIASKVKSQATNVLLKIQDELIPMSPLLHREIKQIKISSQESVIQFHNGSQIRVAAANDNARSLRANIILVDEFVLVDKSIIDTVLKKFLTSPRKPKFLNKPEYKDYPMESNIEMYLSSASYKHHWGYRSMTSYAVKMLEGAKYFVAHLPYQLGIHERIYDKERILNEMTEEQFDEIKWSMEMEATWFGESAKSFFKFDDIEPNRREPECLYPQDVLDMVNGVNNPKKRESEIRILSADIAMIGGDENDASVFSLISLMPNGRKYQKTVSYMETLEGQHSEVQSIRIQQLMYDFNCDYLVIDARNAGIGIIDNLMTELYDEERGVKYDPITVMNDDRYAERCQYEYAEPKIFIITASRELNMEIANSLSDALKRNQIKLLIKEQNAIERLQKNKKLKYMELDPRVKAMLLLPYVNTDLLMNEMLNLETKRYDNGTFTVTETGRMRKDRYTSVSYGNYFANILERQNLRDVGTQDTDISKYLVIKTPKY